MAWSTMATNSCPNTTEVEEAETAGDLHWKLDPPSGLPAATACWTRDEYVLHIMCDTATVSAAVAANELMTKQEMLDHATAPSPSVPTNFTSATGATTCPTTEIDLDWDDDGVQTKVLEYSLNGTSGWTQIGGTIAAGTNSYKHTGLTNGQHYWYRLRYSSESTYATTDREALCFA